jgi:hypothetical protein
MAMRKGWVFVCFDWARVFACPCELVEVELRLKQRGSKLHSIIRRDTDPDTERQAYYKLYAGFVEYQREFNAELIRTKHVELQRTGRPVSQTPNYGWTQVWENQQWVLKPDEHEQQVLAEMIEKREAGVSVAKIIKSLTERGIMARAGRPFHPTYVRKILKRAEESKRPDLDRLEKDSPRDRSIGVDRVGEGWTLEPELDQ